MPPIPPQLRPGAAAQFYPGNETGCLVIHGFMASPGEVGWMGQHLAAHGYTVSVPRLPGHGIDPTHMTRMRWQDWYAHVLDMYTALAIQCEKIYLIGHSMGGMLATLLAADYDPAGLVIADTPFTLPDVRLRYARLIALFMPYMNFPTEETLQQTIRAEQKKRGEPVTGRVHYAKWATRTIHEVYTLSNIARESLPQVNCPTLLLYAAQNDIAQRGDHLLAKEQLASTRIETHLLPEGEHIIFQDTGRDEAFAVVTDFITRLEQPAP